MENENIIKTALTALDSKKALDLTLIRVDDLTVVTEYFIIASATSSTHVRALADEVEDALTKAGIEPKSVEGKATGWILLDYGSVIIHTFTKDTREFYNLERIWNDGEKIDVEKYINKEMM